MIQQLGLSKMPPKSICPKCGAINAGLSWNGTRFDGIPKEKLGPYCKFCLFDFLFASVPQTQKIGKEGLELERILDEAIAAQQTIQQQIEAMNKQQAELQAKAQEIAQYEQQLMQKAAQVDAAYTAMQQNKSPVILPPGFGRKRG